MSGSRALSASWQLSVVESRLAQQRDDIEAEISRVLQRQIDHEILERAREQQLRQQGWHRVPAWDQEEPVIHGDEITAWLQARCPGPYHQFHGRVVFERLEDAVAFALVWT